AGESRPPSRRGLEGEPPDRRRAVGGGHHGALQPGGAAQGGRLARFERPRAGHRPETTYVELPGEYVVALVTLPRSFPGMTLRELGARQRFGVNVIEIKRAMPGGQERRIIPDPSTDLKAGDGLIVVGRPAEIARLSDPVHLAEIVTTGAGGGNPGAGSAAT